MPYPYLFKIHNLHHTGQCAVEGALLNNQIINTGQKQYYLNLKTDFVTKNALYLYIYPQIYNQQNFDNNMNHCNDMSDTFVY